MDTFKKSTFQGQNLKIFTGLQNPVRDLCKRSMNRESGRSGPRSGALRFADILDSDRKMAIGR